MSGTERAAADRAPQPIPRRAGLEAAMRAEQTAILEGREFGRSPVLSRLLRYLVDQTLDGAGDRLKAYSIAVDGLGRPENFDAQHDSYPRVQMVRLRKALELHYAETGPVDGLCLSLIAGSYRVRIGRPEIAYPHLYRQRPDANPPTVIEPASVDEERARSPDVIRRRLRWIGIAVLVVLFALLAIMLWRTAATHVVVDGETSPLLDIGVSGAVPGAARTSAEHMVASVLVDGIRRSWVARVRDTVNGRPSPGENVAYRLDFSVEDTDGAQPRLALQLTDRASAVIWSGTRTLPADSAVLADELGPVIARVAGSSGVIAATETARAQGHFSGGYSCLLGYFSFVQSRDPATQKQLAACLAQPVTEHRLVPTLLAVRAFYTLETGVAADRQAQFRTAAQFAQQALQANDDDAYAQFAMARMSYFRTDCAAGNHHTERALAGNPYDPMIAAVLSGLSYGCGNPQAGAMLDQAFRLRDEGDANVRAFLIFASLSQGKRDRVRELGLSVRPPPGPMLTRYLLIETMVAAAQGRRADAIADWTEFGKLYPGAGSTADEKLRTIILSDSVRHRAIELLDQTGVLSKGK